jgi:peptidyl-dipeptidase Dcp
MKNLITLLLIALILLSCNSNKPVMNENPFFTDFGTPFEVPDFSKIKNAHFMPAFREGMSRQMEEIKTITTNPDPASFANTIEALDYSGSLLTKVSSVFFNLASANTNDSIQSIAKEIAPLLSQHRDNISLNVELFQRVKAVYDQRDGLGLTTEQMKLLDKTYKKFVRGGANLGAADKDKFRKINEELSVLSVQFGDNLLKETNSYKLILEKTEDLAGLPQFVIDGAADAAKEEGMEGKWLITLHNPSIFPFLQYSSRRDLREKVFTARINRCNNGNSEDNNKIVSRIASLRVEKANLLGFPTHAHFILDENMAKTPENVYILMNQVWNAALPVSKQEVVDLQAMADTEGGNFKLEPWDWWYYAEKVRKQKFDIDEEALKPYFKLENVQQGMFDLATRLWGLKFNVRTDIPKPHPEAVTYEVTEADGSHIGILLMDFFPRASKQGGAWMDSYRDQYVKDGKNISPVITMVMNFTKPAGDLPSLLTYEEVETMFHEFGHALHGLFSKCTYPSVAGTSVARDFVELPSQIMENWCSEPEVLKSFAKHYQTGETIPDDILKKMKESEFFNQGFVTVEYTSAAFLDMDWHTLTDSTPQNVATFEKASMDKIGLIPEIIVRYRSPYFAHIFDGGYSAGYYAYQWAEVLDADAFEAFKEHGIFDPVTAKAFRENILEKGGTDDPMKLYVQFRGKEPSADAMLRRKGLLH